MEQVDRIVRPKDIRAIYVKISHKWRLVARLIDLPEYEIDRIAAQEANLAEQSNKALREWSDIRKGAPMASELIRALTHDDVNLRDVALLIFGKELIENFEIDRPRVCNHVNSGLVRDGHIKIVAREGSDRLMALGRCLGYSTTQLTDMISGADLKFEKNSVKLDGILGNWVKEKGDDATVEVLMRACKEVSIGGIVKREFDKTNLL